MPKQLKHDLLGQRYTKIYHEDEPKFNAPHHFTVTAVQEVEGNPREVELQQIHFQEGPIKECGVNGVNNEDLIHMVIARLDGFQNSEYRCRENAVAITKLEEALMWLGKRTQGRINRGVEGTHEI